MGVLVIPQGVVPTQGMPVNAASLPVYVQEADPFAPLFSSLAGCVIIAISYDLTTPADIEVPIAAITVRKDHFPDITAIRIHSANKGRSVMKTSMIKDVLPIKTPDRMAHPIFS